jgi:hypothetical protein
MAYPQPGQFPAYPQYPGQGAMPAKPPIPKTVQNAFYLMLAGAALQLVGVIVGLASTSKIRDSIRTSNPGYTSTQLDNAVHVGEVALVVGALIEIGLWIWMAFANRAGRNWARILGTVFFGLSCVGLLVTLAASNSSSLSSTRTSGLSVAIGIVAWVVGLATVVLLWNKESGAYFKPPQFGGAPGYPYPYGMPGQQPMPPGGAGPQQTPYDVPPQNQPPVDPWSNPPQQ